MKEFIIGIVALSSTSIFANSALDSSNLAGKYKLIESSLSSSSIRGCGKEIEITVNEKAVALKDTETSGIKAYATFWSDDSGCDSKEGDIGPLRVRCTEFKENSVTSSDTSPITIVGFIREFESLKLKGSGLNKLIHKKNITAIPVGILGINKDKEFKCVYERIEATIEN